MKLFKTLVITQTLCAALFLMATTAYAGADTDFQGQYLKSRVSEITMPESCGNPYRESPNFMQFFHSTLLVMAAEKDNSEKGMTDLFAVLALREKMRDMFPSMGEESPLDRLVIAQLCNFHSIELAKRSSKTFRFIIAPTSKDLHTHLIGIAPRLYQDSRKLMIEALAAKAREKNKLVDLERQWDRVQRVKALGEEKVKNLFDETAF